MFGIMLLGMFVHGWPTLSEITGATRKTLELMVLILDGSSEHVANVRCKIGVFREKKSDFFPRCVRNMF